MRKILFSASLFFFMALAASAPGADMASPQGHLADPFIGMAAQKNLASSRVWRILLHYKDLANGPESLIDDPAFFLARDGKRNPGGELTVTLREFFREDINGDDHPICRFPARFRWLDGELGLTGSVPQVSCPMLEKTMENVNPKAVTMIFASAHINSPASMFGHPLIRIDSVMESKLLSQAVNYAAQTPENRGLLFAFYGIFGYYSGIYSLLPYYEKVSEYNDFDLRDLWEYRLDLKPEEARMMLYHLWELKDKYSYYYFFDENCAYIILYLLEAARPSLHLTDGWGPYVIPVDTLRRVINSGIVGEINYRPSKMTKMTALADSMDENSLEAAKMIARGAVLPEEGILSLADDDARKKTLDLATELIQLNYGAARMEKKEFQKRFLATLRLRGTLGGQPPAIKEIETPVRPDMGHYSAAFSIGIESNGGPKGNRPVFSFRPALHDLMDPQQGYVAGSQLEFMSFTFSIQPAQNEVWLEKLDLVNIASITPINELFAPTTWKVRFGMQRRDFANGDVSEAWYLNTGGGYSLGLGDFGIGYAMLEADLQANHNFDNGYAVGPGVSMGFILDPAPGWKTGFQARAVGFLLGANDPEYELLLSQRYTASQNLGIHLELKGARVGRRDISSALLKLIIFL